MKAIVVVPGQAGPTLELQVVADPVPGPTELLIRVRAASLNRADLRRTQMHFAGTGAPFVAGLDMAGEVIGMGSAAAGWSVGDRVMAMTNGCYAEQVVVDHRVALRAPTRLSWAEAAGLPTAYLTAHDALATAGGMVRGGSVLIQGVTSGVGIVAVQIAKALGASLVMGAARNTARFGRLAELGMDLGIDAKHDDVVAAALQNTAGRGVDVIVDMIGGGALATNIACSAIPGRIVSVGRMGGMTDTVDLNELARKRISLVGVTFRTRTIEDKQRLNERFMADLGERLADGRLRPIVDRTYPLAEALAAQAYMASNAHFGKIVLET
ncbi:MAG: zinc-binding dehydrogenase [Betaproteobacteria bacterium]|nr:zinc-binding dehydrogenase [Betaproteobacteria bacterium]